MTEVIAFIVGVAFGYATYSYARDWLLAKLKADPRPVMGGPIQPQDEGKEDR